MQLAPSANVKGIKRGGEKPPELQDGAGTGVTWPGTAAGERALVAVSVSLGALSLCTSPLLGAGAQARMELGRSVCACEHGARWPESSALAKATASAALGRSLLFSFFCPGFFPSPERS